MEPKPKKLLDQMRDAIRLKNYAYSTEKAYVDWVERYIRFHKLRHPRAMNTPEIEAFLTDLAVEKKVSPSTQNQALCSLTTFLPLTRRHRNEQTEFLPHVSLSGFGGFTVSLMSLF